MHDSRDFMWIGILQLSESIEPFGPSRIGTSRGLYLYAPMNLFATGLTSNWCPLLAKSGHRGITSADPLATAFGMRGSSSLDSRETSKSFNPTTNGMTHTEGAFTRSIWVWINANWQLIDRRKKSSPRGGLIIPPIIKILSQCYGECHWAW